MSDSVLVTDTGPGLTPKELDMLFQRFSQVSRGLHLSDKQSLLINRQPRRTPSLEDLVWVSSFAGVRGHLFATHFD